MFIWKTTELANEIKENTLTEKDWKQYYLAGAILMTISFYIALLEARINTQSLIVEAVLMVVIAVIGINITFKTNQNNNGSNFVARIIALSLPIIIKFTVFSVLFFIALGVVAEVAELSPESIDWLMVIFTVLIEALILDKHVISSDCPTGPSEILDNGKGGTLFRIGDFVSLGKKILLFKKRLKLNNSKLSYAKKRLDRFNHKKNLAKYLAVIKLQLLE